MARPAVLMYHAFGRREPAEDPHNLFVPEDALGWQLPAITRLGPLGLDEYLARLPRGGTGVLVTIDDGYESKLLRLAVICRAVPLFDRLYRPIARRYAEAPDKLKFNETLKRLIDALVTDLIETTRARLRARRIGSVAKVRAQRRRLVALSAARARQNRELKDFLFRRLYSRRELGAERDKIVRALEGLFRFFIEHPKSLPPAHFEKTREEPVHRVVCDYIAGMTDPYLIAQHRKHLGS